MYSIFISVELLISALCILGVALGADIATMESDLRNYFSKTRHHDVDQAYKDRAMNFIDGEFKKLGLETVLQEFQVHRISTEVNKLYSAVPKPLCSKRFMSNSYFQILAIEKYFSVLYIFRNKGIK